MKRLLLIGICILAFVLIAAASPPEIYPVYLNGKFLGNAQKINGKFAIPLSDLARAAGGTLTIEDAGLTLNRNTLGVVLQGGNVVIKKAGEANVHKDPYKEITHKGEKKMQSAALFKVNKPGNISTDVLTGPNNTKWVPLSDLSRAFGGGVWTPALNLKPGSAIRFNFRPDPNAILIGL